jgi:hypothetical protein
MRQAKRIADRHHPITRLHLAGVPELGGRQLARRLFEQLQERAVGQRITSDDLRLVVVVFLIEELNLDLRGAFDDVVVGENEAILADDEPRTRRLGEPLAWLLPARLLASPGPKNRSNSSSPPKNSLRSCVRCLDSVRMLTTIGDCDFAIVRNVVASTGPLSGALLVDGIASVCADDVGDRSSREAITMPTTSDAMATRTT